MHLSPEIQRILVEQRRQELRSAFGGHPRRDRRPIRFVLRLGFRRAPRPAAAA